MANDKETHSMPAERGHAPHARRYRAAVCWSLLSAGAVLSAWRMTLYVPILVGQRG